MGRALLFLAFGLGFVLGLLVSSAIEYVQRDAEIRAMIALPSREEDDR